MAFIRIEEKKLISEFRKWLCEEAVTKNREHFSKNSASSYCSYIRKIFLTISEGYNDVLDIATISTVYCVFEKERATLCKYMNDIIIDAIKDEIDSKQRALLQNGKSAIMLYWLFLEEKAELFELDDDASRDGRITYQENIETEVPKIDDLVSDSKRELSSMSMTFEKAALISRFLSQFRTESRQRVTDSNVCYPIKLLLPMFGTRGKEVRARFQSQIMDMIVLISEDGRSIKFDEVRKMDIMPNGEVIVTDIFSNVYPLYTRTDDSNTIVKLNCKNSKGIPDVKELTRDHIVPISEVLYSMDKNNELPCLNKLTAAIYATPRKEIDVLIGGEKGIAEARDRLVKEYPEFSTEQFIDMLLKELEEIEKNITGYEIMQGKYNRLKSGKNRKK